MSTQTYDHRQPQRSQPILLLISSSQQTNAESILITSESATCATQLPFSTALTESSKWRRRLASPSVFLAISKART